MSLDPARLVPVFSIVGCVGCGFHRSSPALDAGDGEPDASDLPIVCVPYSDDNPFGLKDIRYLDATETVYPDANWRVALEPQTLINWATFADARPTDSAMLFDLPDLSIEVAGFLVSRASTTSSASEELLAAQVAIDADSDVELHLRASGSNIRSLDGFDTVVSSSFEIVARNWTDATRLREQILPALLGHPAAEISFPDVGWRSGSDTRFVLTMQTLYRHDEHQTIYVGALAPLVDYDSRGRATGVHADDLSNGSGLTVSFNGEGRECEENTFDRPALADIIWIIDESVSMDLERENVASNAAQFFEKAVAFGLDFRMGVTDMNDATDGAFATRNANGTDERWIMPGEAELFADAVQDPSGPAIADEAAEHGLVQIKNAIERHLTRDAGDPFRIRPDAKLALMVMTDEKPQELKDAAIVGEGNSEPSAEQFAAIMDYLEPFLTLLAAQEAVVNLISEPLPFDPAPCSGEHTYGYYELATVTGGQMASICQEDLGTTLDSMLDVLVGDASPIRLEYVPISASITVLRDGEPVPRSRKRGWDYRGASNSILFYAMPVEPAHPAHVVVGYRRWKDQVVE